MQRLRELTILFFFFFISFFSFSCSTSFISNVHWHSRFISYFFVTIAHSPFNVTDVLICRNSLPYIAVAIYINFFFHNITIGMKCSSCVYKLTILPTFSFFFTILLMSPFRCNYRNIPSNLCSVCVTSSRYFYARYISYS